MAARPGDAPGKPRKSSTSKIDVYDWPQPPVPLDESTPYATNRHSIAFNKKLKMANNQHGSFSIKSDLPIGSDKLDAITLKKRHNSIKVGYPNLIDDSQLRIRTGLSEVFHMHPANLGCRLGAREI